MNVETVPSIRYDSTIRRNFFSFFLDNIIEIMIHEDYGYLQKFQVFGATISIQFHQCESTAGIDGKSKMILGCIFGGSGIFSPMQPS
jgi:hypothetical protein